MSFFSTVLFATFPITLLVYANGEHVCELFSPGQYCTDDLTGYHDCIADVNNQGGVRSVGVVKCQTATRCGCFLRLKCDVEKSQICQPYVEGNFVKNFWTLFDGTIITNSPTGTSIRRLQGEIIQNAEACHLKKYIWDGVFEEFTYVIKNGDKFDQFKGNVINGVGSCIKTQLDSFPAFGDEIKKYTRLMNGSSTQDTWFFQEGARNIGENITANTWVTKNITNANGDDVLKPISFKSEFWGGIGAKFNSVTNWRFRLFFNAKFVDPYFQPHEACL